MNIHIYYGGRGIIDDPTQYVIGRMQSILEELRVNVTRYNLIDYKNTITTLPQTLKDADGIILATTVEWYGIGGYMQQFLDACWLFGDKEKISKIYMCPVVMSTTYGEREAKLNLATAWEILGGLPCSGICGYIDSTITLEMNQQYQLIIEKKTENLYRTISQRMASFPASNQAVRQKVNIPKDISLTPQETEQFAKYVADDSYVQKQKEDIQELTDYFKGMMEQGMEDSSEEYIAAFRSHFHPIAGFQADYCFIIEGKDSHLILQVDGPRLEVSYGTMENPHVEMNIGLTLMEDIIHGRMTFQRAFMSGATTRGDFKALRTLDQLFLFQS